MSSFTQGMPSMLLRMLNGGRGVNMMPVASVNTGISNDAIDGGDVDPATAARSNTPDAIHQAKQDATAASDAALSATANATPDPVPAMLKAAIAMPPPAPSLAPLGQREGSSNSPLFANPSPAPGEPYQAPSLMNKIARVAGVVGNVARNVAPYVGEGARQQQASEFQQQQELAQQREVAAESNAAFERGIQGQAAQRATDAFPLEQAARQSQVNNQRSPEQLAALNDNEVVPLPNGTMLRINKSTGVATPVTQADGTGVNVAPKSPQFSVQTDPKNGYPLYVVDNYTKRQIYPNSPEFTANAPAQQAYSALMQGYNTMRGDKRQDEDFVAGRSDARQARSFAQQAQMFSARQAAADAKPTAQEQNRADFADNMTENLNQLQEIVKRRPELFGPAGGRMTQVRHFFGSSDRDIGALGVIQEQLGMVQQSTHGMRSAIGVQKAADSILNNFHNDPTALMGAINAARNSIQTFKSDVGKRRNNAGGDTSGNATTPNASWFTQFGGSER